MTLQANLLEGGAGMKKIIDCFSVTILSANNFHLKEVLV